MVGITIKQRRAQLTEKCTKARAHFLATEKMVRRDIDRKYPNLEWYKKSELVEKDPRYIEANTRLLALCDAANIMGADTGI